MVVEKWFANIISGENQSRYNYATDDTGTSLFYLFDLVGCMDFEVAIMVEACVAIFFNVFDCSNFIFIIVKYLLFVGWG